MASSLAGRLVLTHTKGIWYAKQAKMKGTIALIALGVIGLGQYAYFQFFTKLAFVYDYEQTLTDVGGLQVPMISVIVIRDWTVGLAGAVIGIILLVVGVYRLKRRKFQGTH